MYVRYSDNAGVSWIGPYICFDGYGSREHEPAVCLMNDSFYLFTDIQGSTLDIFRSDDGFSFTNIQSFNYTNRYIFISHEMIPMNDTDVLFLYTNWTTRGKDGYRANWLEHRRLNESGVFVLIAKFYLGDSACSGDGCIFANQEYTSPSSPLTTRFYR